MKYTLIFKEIPPWMRKDVHAILNIGWFRVIYKVGSLQWEQVLGAVDSSSYTITATPKDIRANPRCLIGLCIKGETGYSPVIKEIRP